MVDFDFARYIAERRGEVVARAQTGASYAFAGERRLRRTFIGARPVTMAIEATTRLWNDRARDELLRDAATAAEESPRVWTAAKQAAAHLRLDAPSVYLAPASFPTRLTALGTDDQPYVVLRQDVADQLSDGELVAVIGHQLGHLQNGHIAYTTAQHYLTHAALFFVRWMVQPAMMALKAWARRAEITCDRAALLASRDLETTLTALVKLEVGLDRGADFDVAAYLQEPEAQGRLASWTEMFRAHPLLPKRVAALRLFADGALYAQVTGGDPTGRASTDDIDKQVAHLLASF